MPKNPVKAEVNNFIGGLITEASELAFPPNASPDIENYEHNRDGSISRRLGMDFEPTFQFLTPLPSDDWIGGPPPVTFKWMNAAGISGLSLLVVQINNSLTFFNIDKEYLSSDGLLGSVSLSELPSGVRYGLASVDGKLVVVAGVEKIAIITYDDGVFNSSYVVLRTRDLWGIENSDERDEYGYEYENDPLFRTTYAPATHIYNLMNQSWGSPRTIGTGKTLTDPIIKYASALARYPSNSEQVWVGLQYKPDTDGNPTEGYYPKMSSDLYGTSSYAAKGYFIIDVINRGASRLKAIEDNYERNPGVVQRPVAAVLPDYTNGGATCLAEFAGRVFYGGFTGATISGDQRSPNLSNYIFFTQLVRSTGDIYKCYQLGDPTSRDESDIVETDGGFIRLSGVESVVGMVPLGNSLVVICSNGVWTITGGSDYGFSATNYRVDKTSSYGSTSAASIVEERGRVFFWGEDGIYAVSKDQLGESLVENISRGVIDTFYKEIPVGARQSAIGVHDVFSGKIRWLYEDTDGSAVELILDTQLKCFYPFRIQYPNSDLKIIGMFATPPFNQSPNIDSVLSESNPVLSGGLSVVVPDSVFSNTLISVKYLIRYQNTFSFCYYRSDLFRDFESLDGTGVDAKARGVTGSITANDTSIKKQVQFLTMHFKQTAREIGSSGLITNETSCLSQTKWEWATSADSKKWSALRQVFRNPKPNSVLNYDVITTRSMIRGQGRSFALYFETEPEKDCHIIGWNLAIDGNSKV